MTEVIKEFFEKTRPFGIPIAICQTGSHAYGLNTATSDEDYKGVFIPNPKYLFGVDKVEQLKVKGDDWVCHEIRQFVSIIRKQNPTMMEFLFMEPIYTSEQWEALREPLRGLITREAFKPYSAYVLSQLTKAKFRQPIAKRSELIEKFGYDTKFMSHVARLAVQCIYLMTTAAIPVRVPEPHRTHVLKIKNGELTKEEAIAYCEELDKQMHDAYVCSVLPKTVDFQAFEYEVFIPIMKEIGD